MSNTETTTNTNHRQINQMNQMNQYHHHCNNKQQNISSPIATNTTSILKNSLIAGCPSHHLISTNMASLTATNKSQQQQQPITCTKLNTNNKPSSTFSSPSYESGASSPVGSVVSPVASPVSSSSSLGCASSVAMSAAISSPTTPTALATTPQQTNLTLATTNNSTQSCLSSISPISDTLKAIKREPNSQQHLQTPLSTSNMSNSTLTTTNSSSTTQIQLKGLDSKYLSDYFPVLNQNCFRLSWQHNANSRKELAAALLSNKLMVSADISLAEVSRYPVPIMAKPPLGISDITLEEWLKEFGTRSKGQKGAKFTFTSTRTVEPAFRVLAKYADSFTGPVILSADILTRSDLLAANNKQQSPNQHQQTNSSQQQPIDAWTFLMLCRTRFPNSIISIGWCGSLSASTSTTSISQQQTTSSLSPTPTNTSQQSPIDSQMETASIDSSVCLDIDMVVDASSTSLLSTNNVQSAHQLQHQHLAAQLSQQLNSQQHQLTGALHYQAPKFYNQHQPYPILHHHAQQQQQLLGATLGAHQNMSQYSRQASHLNMAHTAHQLNPNLLLQLHQQTNIYNNNAHRHHHRHLLSSTSSLNSSSGNSSGSPSPTSPSSKACNLLSTQIVPTNLSMNNKQSLVAAVASVVASQMPPQQQVPLNLNINNSSIKTSSLSSSTPTTTNGPIQMQVHHTHQTNFAPMMNAQHFQQQNKSPPSFHIQASNKKCIPSKLKATSNSQLLLKTAAAPVLGDKYLQMNHYSGGFSGGAYTREMIDKMSSLVKEYNLTQPVTFPIEAKLVRGSLSELQRLLYQVGQNASLTIMASNDDLITLDDIMMIRNSFSVRQLIFDLPDSLTNALL